MACRELPHLNGTIAMISYNLLFSSLDGDNLLRLLGRFHPGIVHFPIALLALAAVLEVWRMVRRKPGLSPLTPVCVVLGALSAVAASVFGWLFDEYDSGGKDVTFHMWVGIGASAGAVVAALLVYHASTSPAALGALRIFLLTGAGLASGTGYLAGELDFGKHHLFRGIFDERKPAPDVANVAEASDPAVPPDGTQLANGKVNFARDVAPILKECCLRCHGPEKVKGK